MSNKPEPNLFLLRDAIVNTIKALDGVEPNVEQARSILDSYDITNLGVDNEARISLSDVGNHLSSRNCSGAKETLELILADVKKAVPRFRLVLMDETQCWTDPALVAAAGKIYGCYLYDETRRVHVAELTASHELHYLYTSTANQVDDDMNEVLLMHGSGGEEVSYFHCSDIERISWDRKLACGESADVTADTYESLLESELEYYRCNWCLETPRKNSPRAMLEVAAEYAEAGEMARANFILANEVGNTSLGIKEKVDAIRTKGLPNALAELGELLTEYSDLTSTQQLVSPAIMPKPVLPGESQASSPEM